MHLELIYIHYCVVGDFMTKVFIDGSVGTTGLRIHERLSLRNDITLISLPEELRKDPSARKKALNESDISFLCLPDDAARESVSLTDNPDTILIDTSTAHRTLSDWAYGFPELSENHFKKIKNSKRIAVPGCHASGFIALIYPLVEKGIIPKDILITSHSITGYSGGGKKMIAEYEAEEREDYYSSPRQYALTQEHKHLKEMKAITNIENEPMFSPIVSDFYSGMEFTIPIFKKQLNEGYSIEDIKTVYREKYNKKLVFYNEKCEENGFICANAMKTLDSMEITVKGNEERILLIARYDNLGKGASGAALECMNIVMGNEEGYMLNI